MRQIKPTSSATSILLLTLAAAVLPVSALADQGPWDRTETRTDCTDFQSLRQPLFGETHVHTALSADAVINGTTAEPRDAYDFAKGSPLPYTPLNPAPPAQLKRPLDFTVATDHAEFLGEASICLNPALEPGYSSTECMQVRADIGQQFDGPLDATSFLTYAIPTLATGVPRFSWCGPGNAFCLAETSLVWQDIADAAEQHYDRSAACNFTTFIGYEWTSNVGFTNRHRNVIFRNENVPALPSSFFEADNADDLRDQLQTDCLDAGTGCDVLAIGHNSNISGGFMFAPNNSDLTPMTAADAAKRQRIEPLMELMQHKADSECHPLFSNDELCAFEKANDGAQGPGTPIVEQNFLRGALLNGLEIEEDTGVNPMALGVLSSTDGHMGMSGLTREDNYAGHVGAFDDEPERRLIDFSLFHAATNPGGLAVVWAEENSRDAIFAAMRRREVYSTTGTRPIVRFFGGALPRGLCGSGELVEDGYRSGVPMGGELGAVRGKASPRFVVFAQQDPGPAGFPGTPLQQIQIVKGWIDAQGQRHEEVHEVAGDSQNGASVDTATCTTSGAGFSSLCAEWVDRDFDRDERAFYYARVVENPTCRWSTYQCNALGVDCGGVVPPEHALCCDSALRLTIQERSVTSPIFYRPESIGKFRAQVSFGDPGEDVLKFTAKLARTPDTFDPDVHDLVIEARDDDVFYSATIPAGTLDEKKPGSWVHRDGLGLVEGIRDIRVKNLASGKTLIRFRTVPMDLSGLDPVEHMVDFKISIGDYVGMAPRRWTTRKGGQKIGNFG